MIYSYMKSIILIKYGLYLKRFIWFIDGALTGTYTPVQSGTENNATEGVFHIPLN